MNRITRRDFIRHTSATVTAAVAFPAAVGSAEANPKRRMTICLSPGSIGVQADQRETIRLAHAHGFESVEPFGSALAGLDAAALEALLADMKSKSLVFAAAGLPTDFRGADSKFDQDLAGLPRIAAALQRAGATRVGTWLNPAHGELTYTQNMRQHATRLRAVAKVLSDHGLRLGLEYVGPQTSRNSRKYPFVHTLAETRDLISAIGTDNVGVILDSWHWYTARDTEADLLSLKDRDVVSVDLNDAPANIPVEQQVDSRRELPCATGVIDLKVFLNALVRIGYEGPVRAEPFNKTLNDLDNEAACAATIAAMRKAFALVG